MNKYQIGHPAEIIEATTPESAVKKLREKREQLDSYYDKFWKIKEVKLPHIILEN